MSSRITLACVGYILVTCCWSAFAEVTMETYTICLNKNTARQLKIFCPSGTQMWINRAYNGRAPWDPQDFCGNPSTDPERDCLRNEIQSTNDLFRRCSKVGTCTKYLTEYHDLEACNTPELSYSGTPYLAVEYTCYTKYDENRDAIRYVNIATEYEQEVTNRVLIQSDQYGRGQYKFQARGGCSVTMPTESHLIVHVMDFRARILSAVGPCAAELVLHNGEQWEAVCGGLTWSYRNYTLSPVDSSQEGRVDLSLNTIVDNSEARLEVIIEGKKNSGGYVQNMRLACGKNHETFTTTTTTTAAPTTTEAPTTTTAEPTTTTKPSTTTAAPSSPDPTTAPSPHTTVASTTGSKGEPQTGGDVPNIPPTPATTPVPDHTTDNGTSATEAPGFGSSQDPLTSKIILGGALGGAVILAALLVGAVCCGTRRARERARRNRQVKNRDGNDVIMAFGGGPSPSQARPKKQQNNVGMNRQRNPYIMNNQRHGSDEFYSEIEDGRSSIQPGWSTDNRSVSPPRDKHNHARNLAVQHDPAFDKPTESTLKMATGTTRGFSY